MSIGPAPITSMYSPVLGDGGFGFDCQVLRQLRSVRSFSVAVAKSRRVLGPVRGPRHAAHPRPAERHRRKQLCRSQSW